MREGIGVNTRAGFAMLLLSAAIAAITSPIPSLIQEMPDTAHLKYRVDPDLKRHLSQAAKDAGKSERSFVLETLAVALGRVSESPPVAAPTDPAALVFCG